MPDEESFDDWPDDWDEVEESDLPIEERSDRVKNSELRDFIERYERLQAEKQEIADQQKEVMAEAKARGYDTKVIRLIIVIRKRDADDVAEEEAILDLYKASLGM